MKPFSKCIFAFTWVVAIATVRPLSNQRGEWYPSRSPAALGRGRDKKKQDTNKSPSTSRSCVCAAVKNISPLNCVVGWMVGESRQRQRQHRADKIFYSENAVLCIYMLACRTYRHNTVHFSTSCIDFHPPGDVIRISVGNCRLATKLVNNEKTRGRAL